MMRYVAKILLSVVEYFKACCRGASQVMLQRSVLCGLFFLSAILTEGWVMLMMAVVSLMLATMFCIPKPGYTDGLCGFNALLVGCAAYVFPCPDMMLLASIVILTGPMKLVLDKKFVRFGTSSLTLSFIIFTWISIGLSRQRDAINSSITGLAIDFGSIPDVLAGLLKGLSQVFLVNSWVGGLLILAGLFVASKRSAVWALVGSGIGMICAVVCGCDRVEIADGLWSFSPVLTAIAVGVTFRPDSASWRWIFVTIGAVILTFAIQYALTPLFALIGLPILTLPFCLATWITIALKSTKTDIAVA